MTRATVGVSSRLAIVKANPAEESVTMIVKP